MHNICLFFEILANAPSNKRSNMLTLKYGLAYLFKITWNQAWPPKNTPHWLCPLLFKYGLRKTIPAVYHWTLLLRHYCIISKCNDTTKREGRTSLWIITTLESTFSHELLHLRWIKVYQEWDKAVYWNISQWRSISQSLSHPFSASVLIFLTTHHLHDPCSTASHQDKYCWN